MTYAITGVIVTGGLVFCLTSCGNKPTANDKPATTVPNKAQPKADRVKENPFEALRNRAFSTTPQQLGLSLPADKIVVYGVIMDWGLGDGGCNSNHSCLSDR